jgi:hypothetical protein
MMGFASTWLEEYLRGAQATTKRGGHVTLMMFVLASICPARLYGQTQSLKLWPVGPEFQVNASTLYDQERPAVAAEANGDFVVVWQYLSEPFIYSGIIGRRFDSAGQPVGTEFQVNTFTTNYYGQRAAVSADDDGDFVVVWDDVDSLNANYYIYGRRYDSAGMAQGADFLINTDTTYNQYNAAVAAEPSGEFVVVWNTGLLGSSPYTQYAFGRRYDGGGIPLGPPFQVNTSGEYYGDLPDVGVAATGDFVVLWNGWFQDNDDFSGVFARKHDSSGTAVTGDLHVNTYTIDNQYGSIAVERDGDFAVVWSSIDQDGDVSGIYAQRYNSAGASSGTEFRVNVYTTGSQETPAVAADGRGNFVVVWNSYDSQDGDLDGIFGRAYDSLGNPLPYTTNGTVLGTEFQVNTYTTDIQRRSAVAAGQLLQSGRLVRRRVWPALRRCLRSARSNRRWQQHGEHGARSSGCRRNWVRGSARNIRYDTEFGHRDHRRENEKRHPTEWLQFPWPAGEYQRTDRQYQ